MVCSDGFGWLSTASGTYEYKTGADFEEGYYECGRKVYSQNAGSKSNNQ